MKPSSTLLLLLAILLATACKTETHVDSSVPAKTVTHSRDRITLRRTECYGDCPMYTITVWDDGEVVYEGRELVGKRGIIEEHIPPQKFARLKQRIERSSFLSITGDFLKECKYTGDESRVILDVRLDGKQKNVEFPIFFTIARVAEVQQLSSIADSIDTDLQTARWVKGTPEQEKSWNMYVHE